MPQEVVNLLSERIISNRGLIQWSPDKDYRRFWISCKVIRLPRHNFLSKKINPDRSEYAQITFMRDGVVLREERLNFESQEFIFDVDPTGYLAYILLCEFRALNSLLGEIGTALGLTVGTAPTIYYDPVVDQFDSIKFVVRPDAAISVKMSGLKYNKNCPEADESEPLPPPPPPDTPGYPPGTDLKDTDNPASPPYDGQSDDGDTDPLPDDYEPEPPPPDDCTVLVVTYSVVANIFGPDQRSFRCYAPFVGMSGDGFAVYCTCAGLVPNPCVLPPSVQSVNFYQNGYTALTVVSVVPE